MRVRDDKPAAYKILEDFWRDSLSRLPMPHSPTHNDEFRSYRMDRKKLLCRIRELQCYLSKLKQVVKAMPQDNASADYLDLDHVERLRAELTAAVGTLCDWEGLGLERSRLGLAR
jgi:hypothetical protein